MRTLRYVALAAAAFALSPAISFGQMSAGTGLSLTPHDFVGGPAAVNGGTVGLCTFCHTPHKAQSTRLLWNHTLSSNTFSWSDAATTTGGTNLPNISPAYQGASVRCLSCHDGTVAIGDVSWFAEKPNNGAGALNTLTVLTAPGQVTPGEFAIASTGGDLKGNHPVAIPFPFGNVASTYNGNTTGSNVDTSEWQANPTTAGIRLFTDTGGGSITAGATAGKTGIECSSCHDPHNGHTVPTTSDFFLRGNFTGSDANYICNKCHKK
jgi:hypothetical protein